MTNSEQRFNSKEFKEVLGRYEAAQDKPDTALFLDVDDILDIAEYYNSKGDMDAAERAADFAHHLYPHSPAVLALLARMAIFRYGDIAKAKQYARQIEEEGEEDLEYFYLKAEIMIAEDNIDEADRFLEAKMSLLDGDDLADFLLDVPELFLDYRLPEMAAKWLARSDEKDSFDYKEIEGRIAFLNEDYKKSERIFKELLEDEPFSPSLWNTLATSQFMNGHVPESIESSEYAIAINPNDAEALVSKARGLAMVSRFTEAADFYRRYLRQYPKDLYIRLLYSVVLIALNEYDKALHNLYYALHHNVSDKGLTVDIVKEISYVLTQKGQYGDAMKLLEDSVESGDIDHITHMIAEGRVLLALGQLKQAADCFADALINNRHAMFTYLEVATSYYEREMYEEAYKTLLAAFAHNPTERHGLAYLADCCRLTGRQGEYLKVLELVCRTNPLEAKEVFASVFPKDVDPKDYYAYALKQQGGDGRSPAPDNGSPTPDDGSPAPDDGQQAG